MPGKPKHYVIPRGRLGPRARAGRMTAVRIPITLATIAIGVVSLGGQSSSTVPLEKLKLPPGFHISVFAEGVASARAMALGANGTVFVGSMSARGGPVYALVDRNGDGRADEMKIVATGLQQPAGVAFHNGSLYVSSTTRIVRLDDIERQARCAAGAGRRHQEPAASRRTHVALHRDWPRSV